jgi:DNA modification methylase
MTTCQIINGDALTELRKLPAESVQCCVTSPPYWGLRDYGVAGQLGLEPTPQEYVAKLVEIFREVRRVLKPDGVLWLNLGDSYCSQGGTHDDREDNQPGVGASRAWRDGAGRADGIVDERGQRNRNGNTVPGMKPKDLVGIPWRVAFALQADGWWLRQDIIWSKPNPMPESVTDRCTKAHEYIFLLSKAERYYYDAAAIAEQVTDSTIERLSQPNFENQEGSYRVPGKTNGPMKAVGSLHMRETQRKDGERWRLVDGGVAPRGERNRRSVWEITTKPYAEAHFATFPPELPRICILAGSKPGDTILDPFAGSGTTGEVAQELGRHAVLIELNPTYCELIRRRTAQTGIVLG